MLARGLKTFEVSLTTTATQLSTLLSLSANRRKGQTQVRIMGTVAAGTTRSALLYGGDASNLHAYVAAGVTEDIFAPPEQVYLKSASGTITITVVLYSAA